jgi:uncharacterized membrane protein YoaK (UPF0700 family)
MTGLRTRPDSIGPGILLTGVGGFLDAFTFVQHRVFANAQTGNVVLLTVELSDHQWAAAARRLAPIIAFIVGVALAETTAHPAVRRVLRRPIRVIMGVEIGLLAIIAVLPNSTPGALVTTTVSFVAALQFATFRTLVDSPYSSLLTTGNLRALISALYKLLQSRATSDSRTVIRFGLVVLAFAVGALVGAIITKHINIHAAAVPAGALVVVLVWFILETHGLEQAAADADDEPAS